MRTTRLLVPALLLAAAAPAAAQLSNRSISVESGLSTPLAASRGAAPALALAAAAWLDGPVEAVARVGAGVAAEPGGRAAARALSGTAGLRVSLLPDPLRPQLGVEVGWARVSAASGAADDRLAFGVTAGLEWFPARDLALAVRGALRGFGRALSGELALAATAYF
jgi:hypothetical protein